MRFVTEGEFQKTVDSNTLLDYEIYPNGQIMVKELSDNPQLFPSILGCVILQVSRQIMNDMIHVVDGFRNTVVAYTDTDSIYIPLSAHKKLEEAGMIGDEMLQCKNDMGKGIVITKAIFLAPKVKLLNTYDELYDTRDGEYKK